MNNVIELTTEELIDVEGGDWYCFAYGAIAAGTAISGQYWGTAAALVAAAHQGCFS